MQSKISTRWTLIIFTIILSIIFLSNDYIFYKSSSSKDPKKILFDTNIINLGLDLQGGKEFRLAPKLEEWLVEKVANSNASENIKKGFNSALLKIDKKIAEDPKYILTIDEIEEYLNEENISIPDLFNGMTKDELKINLDESLSNNIEIIHNRIDDKGVTEASIRKIGTNISVEIPGKKNIDKLEELITSSAKLTINEIVIGPGNYDFITWNNKIKEVFDQKIDVNNEWTELIRDYIHYYNYTFGDEDYQLITISPETKKQHFIKKLKDFNPDWKNKNDTTVFSLGIKLKMDQKWGINIGTEENKYKEGNVLVFDYFKDLIKKERRNDRWLEKFDFLYLDADSKMIKEFLGQISTIDANSLKGHKFICSIYKEPVITGDQIDKSYVSSDEKMNTDYRVNLELNDLGTDKWANFTRKNIGKFAPIIMDNEIISMPYISVEIPNGSCYIDGFKNIKEADYLAKQLKFGKFNLALKKVYAKSIGGSLGNHIITLGMFAFIIGVSLVIIFMILYYKVAGVIASISLLLNILFMSAILSMLGATLTLPGIAGFILTVGIAVDANVIIFERIREEVRNGLPPLSAIESGYDRAFVSIVDANVTTLLTAIILYFLGSGPIKGFAITLSAGIACSMFTAIYITRTIFNTLYHSKIPKKLSI